MRRSGVFAWAFAILLPKHCPTYTEDLKALACNLTEISGHIASILKNVIFRYPATLNNNVRRLMLSVLQPYSCMCSLGGGVSCLIKHVRMCLSPISSCPSTFLNICIQVTRWAPMYYNTDVGTVYTHSKCSSGYEYTELGIDKTKR